MIGERWRVKMSGGSWRSCYCDNLMNFGLDIRGAVGNCIGDE
jgi:hypothetical protein